MVGTSLQFTVPETNLLLQAPLGMRVGLVGWETGKVSVQGGGTVEPPWDRPRQAWADHWGLSCVIQGWRCALPSTGAGWVL